MFVCRWATRVTATKPSFHRAPWGAKMPATVSISPFLFFVTTGTSVIMVLVGTLCLYATYRQTLRWQMEPTLSAARFYLERFVPLVLSGITIILVALYLSGGMFPGRLYSILSKLL